MNWTLWLVAYGLLLAACIPLGIWLGNCVLSWLRKRG